MHDFDNVSRFQYAIENLEAVAMHDDTAHACNIPYRWRRLRMPSD